MERAAAGMDLLLASYYGKYSPTMSHRRNSIVGFDVAPNIFHEATRRRYHKQQRLKYELARCPVCPGMHHQLGMGDHPRKGQQKAIRAERLESSSLEPYRDATFNAV